MAKNMKKSFSKEDKIWITSHEFFLTVIKIYKEHNFWMTGNKSWDLIKWNANGKVLISEKALSKFLSDKNLTKNSKAYEYGGNKGARCFVAEHPVPTSELVQRFAFKNFKDVPPDFETFKTYFSTFNRICYIWHLEDQDLNKAGLRSSIRIDDINKNNMFSRYETLNIVPISTNFKTGMELFKYLKKERENGSSFEYVKKMIKINE